MRTLHRIKVAVGKEFPKRRILFGRGFGTAKFQKSEAVDAAAFRADAVGVWLT